MEDQIEYEVPASDQETESAAEPLPPQAVSEPATAPVVETDGAPIESSSLKRQLEREYGSYGTFFYKTLQGIRTNPGAYVDDSKRESIVPLSMEPEKPVPSTIPRKSGGLPMGLMQNLDLSTLMSGGGKSEGGGALLDERGGGAMANGSEDTSALSSEASSGGDWFSAAGGALNGYMAGRENYKNDPNMRNGKDGYGKYHKDYRAEVGGGFLGGVLGYYGGPVGAAVAGPAVKLAHPVMEPATREVINFGDKVGGSGGALALDPIGTVSSGKYSWGELGKGALLGPLSKIF